MSGLVHISEILPGVLRDLERKAGGKSMKILALDVSLTSTGWATSIERYGTLCPPKGYDRGMLRNDWIARQVMQLADGADVVVIEGYSFGQARGSSQVIDRAELGGLIRWGLWRRKIPYVAVAPAALKKYATGTGKAKGKGPMIAEAVRRLGYTGGDDNEADALWLWNLAACHYQVPGHVPVPASHYGDGTKKLAWPKMAAAAVA